MDRRAFLKTEHVLIALPTISLKVHVRDTSGRPLGGAIAYLTAQYAGTGSGWPLEADEEGGVLCKCLSYGGRYSLEVKHAGYHGARVELPPPGSRRWRSELDVALHKATEPLVPGGPR